MTIFAALLAGLVLGLGLIVSGMANPPKVQGFLDLGGAWDPSLALVMGAAVGVGAVAFAAARQRKRSLLGELMKWPSAEGVDRRLLVGSACLASAGAWPVSAPARAWWRWVWARSRRWFFWRPCSRAWATLNGWSVASATRPAAQTSEFAARYRRQGCAPSGVRNPRRHMARRHVF